MTKCIIYKPARNLMQSGLANEKKWKLIFIKEIDNKQEDLMGWQSSFETQSQVVISFNNKEEALEYVTRNKIDFEIKEDTSIIPEIKSVNYTYTKNRNLYYF